MIALGTVALLVFLAQASPERLAVPPSLGSANCLPSPVKRSLPREDFEARGGRASAVKVKREASGAYTMDGVAQGRNLERYDKLEIPNPRYEEKAMLSAYMEARTFVWEHWRDHRPAYLVITISSVDATSTSHIFVEPDDSGRWRLAERIVRHHGEVDDAPTDYSVEWVFTNSKGRRTPLPSDQEPDPAKHYLEFRDKCGELNGSL